MNCTRWLPVFLVSGLLACAFPAVAGAKDYCVDDTPACGPKNVSSLEQALGDAAVANDADRIFLGAGPHTAPPGGGFTYTNDFGPVEIIGSGQGGAGETILTAQAGASGHVLDLVGGPGTSIHDLKIELPQSAASWFTGLRTNGTARNITVRDVLPQPNTRLGVELSGGTLESSLVTLGPDDRNLGVSLGMAGGTVRDSGVSAFRGIGGAGGGLVERSRIVAGLEGVVAVGQETTIRSSEIKVVGAGGTAIAARVVFANLDTSVVVDGVSIIGPNSPTSLGVSANTAGYPDDDASVTLRNSFLRTFGKTLEADSAGTGTAHISASYSDYEAGKSHTGGSATIDESNVSNVGDVGFLDPSDGDWFLVPGSPLVDMGDPSTPQGLDRRGDPLVTDGNHDGIARRDIGAYELAGPLPVVDPPIGGGGGETGDQAPAADKSVPVLSRFSAATARRTRFRYALNEPARVTIVIQRASRRGGRVHYRTFGRLTRSGRQGLNRTARFRKVGGRVLRAGSYRAVARATDVAGNRSAPRRARFRIVAP